MRVSTLLNSEVKGGVNMRTERLFTGLNGLDDISASIHNNLFRLFLSGYKSDVFVAVYGRDIIAGLILKNFTNCKLVFIQAVPLNNPAMGRVKNWLRRIAARILYPSLDALVFVSNELFAIDGGPYIKRIPLVTSLPNPVVDEYRLISGCNNDCFNLVSVARLSPEKNHELIIRSLAAIRNNGISITLDIYGSGPIEGFLRDLALDLGVSDLITFKGFTRREEIHLTPNDVFVLTSYYEGLPSALIEALSFGARCIAIKCPTGPEEILAGLDSCILLESYGIEPLSDAILEMYGKRNTVKNIDELTERANKYSIKESVTKYHELFKNLTVR